MPTVFISHATLDDDKVTSIAHALTAAGLEVWVDHFNGISYGDAWSRAIHDATNACDCGLFVLSPRSAQSEYCDAEWNRVRSLGKPLYVALIENVPLTDIPLLISRIQYADLTADFEGNLNKLIAVLLGKAAHDPTNPTASTLRLTGHIDSLLRDIRLIGREADLTEVRRKVSEAPTFILGVGGLGKSRLAAEVALTSSAPGGVVWHRCTETSTDESVLLELRQHYRLPKESDRPEVLAKLAANPILLVLDNAEDVTEGTQRRAGYVRLIKEIAPFKLPVLLTSRVEWSEVKPGRRHEPTALDLDAATQIVLEMQTALGVETDLSARAAEIAQAARLHPRLIEWAVGQIDHQGSDKVLKWLRELKNAKVQDALNEMVVKTYDLMKATAANGEDAAALLRRLNVCRGGFTYGAAKALTPLPALPPGEGEAQPDSTEAWDEDRLDNALDTLQSWRFIHRDAASGRYSIDLVVIAALGEGDSAHLPHYAYYKALANHHREKQDYLGLDVESDNLEAAFEWAMSAERYEDAYWLYAACSNFLANRGRFPQRMEWLERVATKLADSPDEALRANVQNSLGNLYSDHPLGDRRANLERAIAAFQQALIYRTLEAAPLAYATIQNNLGTAYCDLAAVEDREENLKRAIATYQQALIYCTPEAAPLDYAMTQNNLGTAYQTLAAVEDRAENLQRTIAAYQQALIYRTPEAAPLAYAMTQNNLGTAYQTLAAVEDRAENLQRTIAAYQQALIYRTPEAAPLDYATTQRNLGIAYEETGDLPQAIACWREAEKYYRQMGMVDDADLMLEWIAEAEGQLGGDGV